MVPHSEKAVTAHLAYIPMLSSFLYKESIASRVKNDYVLEPEN